MPEINLHNIDCMNFMADKPNNYYDLAIVDPPYGIGEDGRKNHTRSNLAQASDYRNFTKYDCYKPDEKYFKELFRISKNQIIWGANHFGNVPASPSWIVWDKENGKTDFADCELAFTSHKKAVRKFVFRWAGMLQGDMKNKQERIHPNEKPYELYRWLLKNYTKLGDKILDTHLGSMSIAIACADMGFSLDGCELDKDYFEAGKKRYEKHISQVRMF